VSAERIAAAVAAERADQGLPPHVEDELVLDRVVDLLLLDVDPATTPEQEARSYAG
jgi:hypothetical protein